MDLLADLDDHARGGAPETLRRTFLDEGFVAFSGLLGPPALAHLRTALVPALRLAVRRDLVMPGSDSTPRRMMTVGGDVLAEQVPLVPRLYRRQDLLASLSRIVDGPVLPVPDPIENHVLNLLTRPGDIHGAHLDTYAYAFTILLEAPPPDARRCRGSSTRSGRGGRTAPRALELAVRRLVAQPPRRPRRGAGASGEGDAGGGGPAQARARREGGAPDRPAPDYGRHPEDRTRGAARWAARCRVECRSRP